MVERTMFYQNPRKQRWAKRYLWRHENLWRVDRVPFAILIALAGAIAGYLNFFMK
jgi:anti-sigma-K factor RskA